MDRHDIRAGVDERVHKLGWRATIMDVQRQIGDSSHRLNDRIP
jgi:hypothetical protein